MSLEEFGYPIERVPAYQYKPKHPIALRDRAADQVDIKSRKEQKIIQQNESRIAQRLERERHRYHADLLEYHSINAQSQGLGKRDVEVQTRRLQQSQNSYFEAPTSTDVWETEQPTRYSHSIDIPGWQIPNDDLDFQMNEVSRRLIRVKVSKKLEKCKLKMNECGKDMLVRLCEAVWALEKKITSLICGRARRRRREALLDELFGDVSWSDD